MIAGREEGEPETFMMHGIGDDKPNMSMMEESSGDEPVKSTKLKAL